MSQLTVAVVSWSCGWATRRRWSWIGRASTRASLMPLPKRQEICLPRRGRAGGKTILVHRAPPKRSKTEARAQLLCASDAPTVTLDGILKHISKTLGFPATRFRLQTGWNVGSDLELAALPDGTLVFEAEVVVVADTNN